MDMEAVRLLLQRSIGAGMTPGAVALVETPGRRSTVAVGWARVLPERWPASEETLYDLASLTKPLVTTTLFLLARRQGRLELGMTVEESLPEASGSPCGGLTMHQLLTHTSGLPAWLPLYAMARGRLENAFAALLETQPVGPPGGQVIYSCPGFILLGWILERILKRPLDRAFHQMVARPLGLEKELRYRPDPRSAPLAGGAADARIELELLRDMKLDPLAGHLPPAAEGMPDDGNARFLGGAAGNAGLWGTARAVARLAAEYFPGGGRVLGGEEAALATRLWTEGLEQGRGFGWQLAFTPGCSAGAALSPGGFGHTGFTGTSLWADPADRRILVLLANRHHPAHRSVDLHPLRRRFHALGSQAVRETPRG